MRRKRFIRLVSNMGQRSCPHEESNVFTALPLSHRDSTMSYHEVYAYVARIQSDNYDKRYICEQNKTRRAQIYHLSYLKSFSKFSVKIHSLSETGTFSFFFFSFSGEQRKAQETRLAQLEEHEWKKKPQLPVSRPARLHPLAYQI